MRFPVALALSCCLGACAGPGGEPDPAGEASPSEPAAYVGVETCARCHASETELWRGSHHDLAMQEPSEAAVLGRFDDARFVHEGVETTFFRDGDRYKVRTEGPGGELEDFEVAYTFGVEPLQQYLLRLPRGKLQALSVAWDSRPAAAGGQRWFHLYPDEAISPDESLHWTKRLQNWNLMCAECHSTALDKRYDFATDSYDTTWSEIDVACEACHGPGSRHVAWGEKNEAERGDADGLEIDLSDGDAGVWEMDMSTGLSKRVPPRASRTEIEMCARCHARRSSQLADYVYGEPLLDTHRVALLEEPLYYADGQILEEVYVYGSFLQSKMYAKGVTCKDCHEPHALRVRGEGSSVCGACHDVGRFDTRAHHFHAPGTAGSDCVDCHMPTETYMVVDPRRDHSFRLPRPDLTARLGVPNACNACHRDRSPEWAAEKIVAWYGPDRPDHYGPVLDAGRRGLPGAGDALGRLATNGERPGIVRATALEMLERTPSPGAAASIESAAADPDPIVRLGALEGAGRLDPAARHRLAAPLLEDPVRNVRLEASRLLADVPAALFTPGERESLERGLEEYRQAQLRNADWPESQMNLALLQIARGKLAEAQRSYENALRLDPSFTQAYVNLADLHRMQGREAEGEALLRRAARRLPAAAEIHHALGLALVRMGRSSEALEELRLAAEQAPAEPRYAYVYGVALDGAGDTAGAIAELERAAAAHPYDVELLYGLASFEAKRGRFAEALGWAKRLVEASPGDPGPRQLLSQIEAASAR